MQCIEEDLSRAEPQALTLTLSRFAGEGARPSNYTGGVLLPANRGRVRAREVLAVTTCEGARKMTTPKQRARELRRDSTKAETLLWAQLRDRRLNGYKFRRQHPIGPFFADFACIEHRLVVEVDGESHDWTYERDAWRERSLARYGSGWRRANDPQRSKGSIRVTAALTLTFSRFAVEGTRSCAPPLAVLVKP
jgi:very-short-patch-repair endonuclease